MTPNRSAPLAAILACMACPTLHAQQPAVGLPDSWDPPVEVNEYTLVRPSSGNLTTALPVIAHGNLATGPGIAFVLFHNSRGQELGGIPGWRHSYAGELSVVGDSATFQADDGRSVQFARVNGLWERVTPGYPFALTELPTEFRVDSPANGAVVFDTAGRLIRVEDTHGRAVTIERDASDRLWRVRDATGRTIECSYDSSGNLKEVSDEETAWVWTLHYSGNALQRLEYPNGQGDVLLTYSQDRIETLSDPESEAWQFEYDASDRVTKVIEPITGANDLEFTYTTSGSNLNVEYTNRSGSTYTFVYDAFGRRIERWDPLLGKTFDVYDADHRRISAQNEAGSVWLFEYDANGNLLKTTDPENNSFSKTYNALGAQDSYTDALGQTTTAFFDDPVNPKGATTVRFPLDMSGSIRDPMQGTAVLSAEMTLIYYGPGDGPSQGAWSGQPKRWTDAGGAMVRFQYDSAGQVNRMEEGPPGPEWTNSYVANFTYALPSVILPPTIDPVTTARPLSYPPIPLPPTNFASLDTNTIVLDNYRGQTVRWRHERTRQLGGSPTTSAKDRYEEFDAVGRLTSVTIDSDEFGSLLSRTHSIVYDDVARTETTTAADGHEIMVTRDPAGRAVAVRVKRAFQQPFPHLKIEEYAIQRDAVGRLKRIDLPSGGRIVHRYTAGGMRDRTTYRDASNQVVYRRVLQHNANGRVSSVTESGSGTSAATTDITYNTRGWVIRETRTGNVPYDHTFTYDAAGNRLTREDAISGERFEYVYDVHAEAEGFDEDAFASRANQVVGWRRFVNGILMSTAYLYDDETAPGNVGYIAVEDHGTGGSTRSFQGTRLLYNKDGSVWARIDETFEVASDQVVNHVRTRVDELLRGSWGLYALVRRDPVSFDVLEADSTWLDRIGPAVIRYGRSGGVVEPKGIECLGLFEDAESGHLSIVSDPAGNIVRMVGTGGADELIRGYTVFGEVLHSVGSAGIRGFGGANGAIEAANSSQPWIHSGKRWSLPMLGRSVQRERVVESYRQTGVVSGQFNGFARIRSFMNSGGVNLFEPPPIRVLEEPVAPFTAPRTGYVRRGN